MKEQHISGYEEYKERQKWARSLAQEMSIRTDESAEHFVVPVLNEAGKETGQIMLAAREQIPLVDADGHLMSPVDARTAIEVSKKYPHLSLSEGIKALNGSNK